MKPLIGITTYQDQTVSDLPVVMIFRAYIQAVVDAGGAPVLIPSALASGSWDALYTHLDGILFAGGGDISLEHFEGDDHPRIDGVDPERDAVELAMLQAAVKDDKPFLGICRGIQVVNVGLGGTLYTHIPDQFPKAIDHTYPGNMRMTLAHKVMVESGTHLADIVRVRTLMVNSLHHQGLKNLAKDLRVAARASDGLVEAVELPDHPFGLAIQWHPEWLTDQLPTQALFRAFVDACISG